MSWEGLLRRFVLYGVFVIVIGTAALLILSERSDGWVSWLLFLPLLACPLMHITMHRHHGRRSSSALPQNVQRRE